MVDSDTLYEARHRLIVIASERQATSPSGIKIGLHGWQEQWLTLDEQEQYRKIEEELDKLETKDMSDELDDLPY